MCMCVLVSVTYFWSMRLMVVGFSCLTSAAFFSSKKLCGAMSTPTCQMHQPMKQLALDTNEDFVAFLPLFLYLI